MIMTLAVMTDDAPLAVYQKVSKNVLTNSAIGASDEDHMVFLTLVVNSGALQENLQAIFGWSIKSFMV